MLTSIRIQGYRPFRDFKANFGPLEVLVGANGAGKTALGEFLRFLRDGMEGPIPPEIVAGGAGRRVFHAPGPESIEWSATFGGQDTSLLYEGKLVGPIGRVRVVDESVARCTQGEAGTKLLYFDGKDNLLYAGELGAEKVFSFASWRNGRLTLGLIQDSVLETLTGLRDRIADWRFYASFQIDGAIRQSVTLGQEPQLRENGANLSSVLHYLMTEHPDWFSDYQDALRLLLPSIKSVTVKARGGQGQVLAYVRETGSDEELSLADLSDGMLRLMCWTALCFLPHPPPLIFIDEPDQGVHPRTLPILAGLFEKASERTQIILTTHNSYFLSQFDLARIGVVRRVDGEATFVKPADSAGLRSILDDFGTLPPMLRAVRSIPRRRNHLT